MKTALALLCFALSLLVAAFGQPVLAVVSFAVSTVILAPPQARCCVTLVGSPELLLGVLRAFLKQFPLAKTIGGEFKTTGVKLNKEYTAHIQGPIVAEDVTTTYAVTGQDARDTLSDVNITVSKRKGARLYWQTINAIKDDKFQHGQTLQAASYAVGKAFVDDLLTDARSDYFSYDSIYAEADADVDALINITGDMNTQGAGGGRSLIINTPVANTLQADSRITSKDFEGFRQGEKPFRVWENTNGFSLIQEYPDFSLNNGTALTGVSVANTGDLFTKAAHGLSTGQRVYATGFSAGWTAGYYFVIVASSSTFQLADTLELALAGTATAASADGTGGTVTPTENLIGFATDRTGINFVAGPEDHMDMDALAAQLGAPEIMHFETISEGGVTMSAVSFREAGTNNLTWMPLLLWG